MKSYSARANSLTSYVCFIPLRQQRLKILIWNIHRIEELKLFNKKSTAERLWQILKSILTLKNSALLNVLPLQNSFAVT